MSEAQLSKHRNRAGRLTAAVVAILLMIAPRLAADNSDEAWAALAKGGHVALIRHGNAPPGYGGDPPGFRFDDCRTQRNLDDTGRGQARALGEAFRKHGVHVDRIVSSPVCRCMEASAEWNRRLCSWWPVSYQAMGRWMLEEAAANEFVRVAPIVSRGRK